MYRMTLAGALVAMLMATSASAQESRDTGGLLGADGNQNAIDKQVTMTPEIQAFLEQLARYESPEQRVQRNAAFRSAQRRMRIAAREWYGVSLSRPTASPLPQMGIYSPGWVGTYGNPNIWLGYGRYQAYQINDRAFR